MLVFIERARAAGARRDFGLRHPGSTRDFGLRIWDFGFRISNLGLRIARLFRHGGSTIRRKGECRGRHLPIWIMDDWTVAEQISLVGFEKHLSGLFGWAMWNRALMYTIRFYEANRSGGRKQQNFRPVHGWPK
jgi:hypothetical protein